MNGVTVLPILILVVVSIVTFVWYKRFR